MLNGVGPFASLYDIDFPNIANPIWVLKSEEPDSKQKPATEYGYSESICHDMISHLINDIAVMGARPLAVLAVASNGLHTNGYTPVRLLMDKICGVGLIVALQRQHANRVEALIKKHYDCYEIGEIKTVSKKVAFKNHMIW